MFMFTFSRFHYSPVHFSHHDRHEPGGGAAGRSSVIGICHLHVTVREKKRQIFTHSVQYDHESSFTNKITMISTGLVAEVMIFSWNFVHFMFERMRQLMGLSVIALSQRVMRVREPVDRHCDYAREIIAPSSFGRAKLNCPLSLGLRSIGGSQSQPLHRRLSSKSASGSQNSWWQTAHINNLWEIMGRRRKRSSGMLECHAERQRLYMELW